MGFSCSTSLSILVIVNIFNFNYFCKCVGISICIFLLTNFIEHLFLCHSYIFIYLHFEVSIQISSPLLKWGLCILIEF